MRMNKKGFTLLEILLVVAIIAILAGIVILSINPSKQFADANNTRRWADANTILNAVYQYTIDNKGAVPSTIPSFSTEICRKSLGCTEYISLDVLTTNEKYLVDIPVDPSVIASHAGTGYFIFRSTNNRITVDAPMAENGVTISVSK